MSTNMLSTCCGALPVAGIVRDYKEMANGVIARVGTCSLCGNHVLFAPGGELETSPRWLRLPPLPLKPSQPDQSWLRIDKACRFDQQKGHWPVLVILWVALAGWLAFIALGTWGALHRGREGESGHGAFKGSLQEQVGGGHAPQGATKGQGGKQ